MNFHKNITIGILLIQEWLNGNDDENKCILCQDSKIEKVEGKRIRFRVESLNNFEDRLIVFGSSVRCTLTVRSTFLSFFVIKGSNNVVSGAERVFEVVYETVWR